MQLLQRLARPLCTAASLTAGGLLAYSPACDQAGDFLHACCVVLYKASSLLHTASHLQHRRVQLIELTVAVMLQVLYHRAPCHQAVHQSWRAARRHTSARVSWVRAAGCSLAAHWRRLLQR
jgi:hypothetical protein